MYKSIKNLLLSCFLLVAMTSIGNAAPAAAEAVTINPVFEKDIAVFDSDFNNFSVDSLIEDIDKLIEDGQTDIVISLNSYGGRILSGNKLIHYIFDKQSKGIRFIGIVKEYCMSMCFITYQFLDERYMYPFAMLLDHEASGGSRSTLIEISEMLNQQVYKRLKVKDAITIKLYKLMVSNSFMFNSMTAKQLGLTDSVIMPGQEIKPVKKDDKTKK